MGGHAQELIRAWNETERKLIALRSWAQEERHLYGAAGAGMAMAQEEVRELLGEPDGEIYGTIAVEKPLAPRGTPLCAVQRFYCEVHACLVRPCASCDG